MKQLHFHYRMSSKFDSWISEHSFMIKCLPSSNNLQKIRMIKEEITPVEWISEGTDSFGTSYIYGHCKEAHDTFLVEAEGYAVVERKERGVFCERISPVYRFPTSLTACSDEMKQFAEDFRKEWKRGKTDFLPIKDMAYALMRKVYQYMNYCPGTTDTKTKACQAFEKRQGVCQDYAHIFIALCRYLSIPAFYAAGYMIGEGASHAWAAFYDGEKKCWYEIDPTNDRWADDGYILVSHGLDASDCIMNKGIYRGFAAENQDISVIVEEIE